MFNVTNNEIILSRGDTGALEVEADATRADTGEAYTFGERDRGVFSIKNSAGTIVKQKAYPIVNNMFTVIFLNSDTDKLPVGGYSWDVRYVINPYYDDAPPSGTWTDYGDLSFPIAKGDHCMHEGTYYVANQAITNSETWTPAHWDFVDYRIPVDGDQVITPENPMAMNLLTVVGDI